MQIFQLLLVLAAIGLNILVYTEVIAAYLDCNAGDCGAVHLFVIFTAPVLLAVSIFTFVLARIKLASQTASPEQIKSARLIKNLSIVSIVGIIAPIFTLPLILMVIEFFINLF